MAKLKEISLKGRISPDGRGVTFTFPDIAQQLLYGRYDEEVDMTFIFGKIKRSLQQNRYLWGVAYEVIVATTLEMEGIVLDKNEIHTHNMQIIQGIKLEWKKVMGQDVLFIEERKSSDMSTEEFSLMVDNLIKWYAENKGIYIPLPEEDNTIDSFINKKNES